VLDQVGRHSVDRAWRGDDADGRYEHGGAGTSPGSPRRYAQAGFAAADIHQLLESADGVGIAPLDSPTASYTFDGVREGVAKAP
jgi:hypothetical protein